jgi:tetratricopeptide (TPR) repeat protein
VACGLRSAHAATGCQALAARNKGDIPALANAGLDFSRQRHYREAADCYRKALALEPKVRELQLNLGLAEFKLGDFQAALGPLGAVLATDPESLQARTLLGMSYYGAGMYAKAVPELDHALAAEPANTQLHYVVAQSCLWSSQYDRALKEFEWLLREQPNSAATHILMGEALDGLGRGHDAIAEFQAAAAVSPAEPAVHFGLGYLYWKERLYDEAEREFRLELAQDSSHAQAAAYLGDVLVQRDEPAAAEPLLEKARRLNPKIRIAYLDLGIIHAEREQYQTAAKELREAVRLDAGHADAHYRLAQVYQKLGRQAEAKAELATVKQLHENRLDDLLHKVSGQKPGLEFPNAK